MLSFIGFESSYESIDRTKAAVLCDTHGVFKAGYSNFVLGGGGCPSCANYGFDSNKIGYVYALLSDCGLLIKIGITNHVGRRISKLKRATPFGFHLVLSVAMTGARARDTEKNFHRRFPSASLSGFDGATEWLKFDEAILQEMRAL